MTRARAADRAGDQSGCEQALADAQRTLGPECTARNDKTRSPRSRKSWRTRQGARPRPKAPSICQSHLSLHRNVQAGSQQICGVKKFRQNIDHLCRAIELIASTYDPAYVREFTAVREYERDITLLIGLLGGFQEFDALDIKQGGPAMSSETGKPTLYERLGGVYSIATVVDDFIDRVMRNPVLNANTAVDEAHHRVSPSGFKYYVTEMVCWATGGPQTYTGRSRISQTSQDHRE